MLPESLLSRKGHLPDSIKILCVYLEILSASISPMGLMFMN